MKRENNRLLNLYAIVFISLYGCWFILLYLIGYETLIYKYGISRGLLENGLGFIILILAVIIVHIINYYLEEKSQKYIDEKVIIPLKKKSQDDFNKTINITDDDSHKYESTKPKLSIVESSREKVRKRAIKDRLTGFKPVKKKHPKKTS